MQSNSPRTKRFAEATADYPHRTTFFFKAGAVSMLQQAFPCAFFQLVSHTIQYYPVIILHLVMLPYPNH
jgi:hypothetical protein